MGPHEVKNFCMVKDHIASIILAKQQPIEREKILPRLSDYISDRELVSKIYEEKK